MTPLHPEELQHLAPGLALEMANLSNLEAILEWAPTLAGLDSIPMDEYNHDILVSLPEGRWAVFGVT